MSSLAYVIIDLPDRRLDVALPATVPLAELLPTLLRAGGTDLAGRAATHGGWCLRRADGAPLGAAQTLDDQGVRDGDVLVLAGCDLDWPEPVVDDIAIAAAGNGGSDRWSLSHTHGAVAVLVGSLALAAGAAVWRSGTTPVALLTLAAAVALLVAGFVQRGSDLAVLGLPYAAAGAAVLGGSGFRAVASAGAAAAVYCTIALCTASARRPVYVGGLAVAIGAVGAAVAGRLDGVEAAAAITLGYAVLIASAAPALAVRVGGLAAVERGGGEAGDRLGRALSRTDEVISGLVWAGPAVTAAGAAALVSVGRWPAGVLLGLVGLVLVLRARLHQRPGHRMAMLAAAAVAIAPALAALAWQSRGAPVLLVVPVVALLAGRIRTSPYLARIAEVAEVIAMAALVPAICLNLGLFGPL